MMPLTNVDYDSSMMPRPVAEPDPWAGFQDAPGHDPWSGFEEAPKQKEVVKPITSFWPGGNEPGAFEQRDPRRQAEAARRGLTAEKVGSERETEARLMGQGVPVVGSRVSQTPEMEQYESEHPGRATGFRAAGNLVSTAPLAAAAPELFGMRGPMWARPATAGTSQAGLSYVDALSRGANQHQAGETALASGGLAAGTSMADALISPMIAPPVRPNARLLHDAGVEVAPWQAVGGTSQSLANKATSVPIVGENISGATDRSIESFQRGRLNRVLDRINQPHLPEDTPINRDTIEGVSDTVSREFQRHIPNTVANFDHQWNLDTGAIADRALGPLAPTPAGTMVRTGGELPPRQAAEFQRIMNQYVDRPFGLHGGVVPGEVAQGVDITLGQTARGLTKNPEHYDQVLGQYVREVQDRFRDLLVRGSPPEASQGIVNARRASAEYQPIRAAVQNANEGFFTPSQYTNAVRKSTPSQEQWATRTGNADRVERQRMGEAAQDILPNKVPDSGTAGRKQLMETIAALAMGKEIHPGIAATALGGLAATSGPALRAGTGYLMSGAPQAISTALRSAPLVTGGYPRENPEKAAAIAKALKRAAGVQP
jgi:hypothetical protein